MIVEHNQSSFYDNKFKFNGKELDAATGMYYYGARYYDPRISIFVSVDPLAERTMEPYLYTGNNPIMFTDPTGMSKEWIPGADGENRVTYTEDKKGNVTFQNLQEDLKPIFEELVKTDTGKEELLSLINDDSMKVSFHVSDEKKVNYDNNYKKDMPVNGTFHATKLNEDRTAVLEADIYLYKGWIKADYDANKNSDGAYFSQMGKSYFFKDFNLNQLYAGTVGHEIRHRFPNNLKALAPEGTNTEFNPNLIQSKIYDEMLKNKENEKGNRKKRR